MARTRTRSLVSPVQTGIYQNFPYNPYTGIWGTPTTIYTSSINESNLSESIQDQVVPNFFKERAKGKIFNNPMSQSKVLITQRLADVDEFYQVTSSKTGSCLSITKKGGQMSTAQAFQHFGVSSYLTYLTPPSYTERLEGLKDRAVTAAYANRSTADTLSLVTATELALSFASIGGILKNVNKIAKRTRRLLSKKYRRLGVPNNIKPDDYKALLKSRGKSFFKDLVDYQKSAEDIWMHARYSLRPLYYDMLGFSKALSEPLKEASRQTSRGYTSYGDSITSSYVKTLEGTYHRLVLEVERKSEIKVKVRAGVLDQIENESRAAKLGLYEIPASIWDLMPCSFVFDWFWNIGNTIQAWTPRMASRVLASWVCTEITQTQSTELSVVSCTSKSVGDYYGSNDVAISNAKIQKDTILKTRIPNPQLSVLPTFNVRMDPAKLIDLGIILKQFALNKSALLKYRA